jgi:hypothetical protein
LVVVFTLVVVMIASLVALAAVQAHRHRAEARRFHWQFATYAGGRLVHAVPISDIQHIEDQPADCSCGPWSERFERGDGSYGDVIYHQRVRR